MKFNADYIRPSKGRLRKSEVAVVDASSSTIESHAVNLMVYFPPVPRHILSDSIAKSAICHKTRTFLRKTAKNRVVLSPIVKSCPGVSKTVSEPANASTSGSRNLLAKCKLPPNTI